jgi:hypothetical protein
MRGRDGAYSVVVVVRLLRRGLGLRQCAVAPHGREERAADQHDTDETGDDLVDLVLDGDQQDRSEGTDRVVGAVLQVHVVVECALTDQVHGERPYVHGADAETKRHQNDVVRDGECPDHAYIFNRKNNYVCWNHSSW